MTRPKAGLPRGAYGLKFLGQLLTAEGLGEVSNAVGELEIIQAAVQRDVQTLERGNAYFQLRPNVSYEVREVAPESFRVTLEAPSRIGADELLHPYLPPAASLIHAWAGMPCFHGAAVANEDVTFVLVGGPADGKSTTAAALASSNFDLLADDLVVLEGNRILPGPPILDRRPESHAIAPISGRSVRDGTRIRQVYPSSGLRPIVSCFVHLEFGAAPRLSSLSHTQRLTRMAAQLYWPTLERSSARLLELVQHEHILLTRPRGAFGLASAEQLLHKLAR